MKILIINYLKCILQCSGIKEKDLSKIIVIEVVIFLLLVLFSFVYGWRIWFGTWPWR